MANQKRALKQADAAKPAQIQPKTTEPVVAKPDQVGKIEPEKKKSEVQPVQQPGSDEIIVL